MSQINHYDRKPREEDKALSSLLGLLSLEKGKILTGTFMSVIGTLLALAAPLVLMFLSQELLNFTTGSTLNWPYIIRLCVISAACFLLSAVCQCIQTTSVSGVVARSTQRLRDQMSVKINRLPLNYFDTRSTGDVLSYLTNDVDIVGATMSLTLSSLISSGVTVLGVLIILVALSWKIALAALILLPIVLSVLTRLSSASEKHYAARTDITSAVSAHAEESYTGFNILRVFNAAERNTKKFAAANYELEQAMFQSDYLADVSVPLTTFFGNLMFSIVALVGGILVAVMSKDSGATPESVNAMIAVTVAAVSYAVQLVNPITQIATAVSTLQQTMASARRIYAFLGEENEPDESEKTTTLPKIEGNISFEHVRFGYTKDRIIVHDFCEVGKPGQKIAIVGPTGAGKTTMVNLLMRFYEINSGSIKIEGVDTRTMKRGYVRSLFGMVLQDTWLFEGTIMENLKYSRPDATDEEVYAACRATHCDDFIRRQPNGYNTILNEDCGLAAGQKQLLTIARAMVQNAPMMILDEATSSVDTRTELMIQDAMDNLMKGRTSFIIAHRLSTIKNSDLIIVMKDGDVLESGNHDELMKLNGFYAALYNAQFTGEGPQFS